MAVHTVRDLKHNPSRLYRELAAGETAVLTRRGQPVGVAVPFDLVIQAGAAAAVATQLLRTGAISLGEAARIAGRSVEAYMEVLAAAGVDDVLYDEERLAEDLDTLATL